MTATAQRSGDPEPKPALQATLLVEPHPAAGCAVLAAGERGEDVVRSPVAGGSGRECGEEGDEACDCRAAVTVTDGDANERRLVDGTVDGYCVCPAFDRSRCVPEIRGFRDGRLVVAVTAPDRVALRELVAALREREATVHLERVLPLATEDRERTISLDVREITDKQREALETAVRAGYYETPRRADLSDLAAELGVSRSAVSQRLNAAEATLVGELVGGADGPAADGRDPTPGDVGSRAQPADD